MPRTPRTPRAPRKECGSGGVLGSTGSKDAKSPHPPMVASLASLASLPCTLSDMAPRLDPEGDMTRRLREALRSTKESIRSISKATGVTRQTLMAFRDGERTILLNAADRIAAHFRLSLRKDKR